MTKRSAPFTLAAMSLGYGVVQLDVTIVNVAINSIGESLHGSVAAMQWVVNAYTIAFAAFILTAGVLGDRLGAKRVMLTGFATFTVASGVCALAPSLSVLVAARIVQGIGASVLVPNSLALLNHAYSEEHERQRAVAIWAAGASVTLTAGPVIGGILIATQGWRDIFFVNLPIGVVGFYLTMRYTAETPRSASQQVDFVGQVLAMLALASLAAAMIGGGRLGWADRRVLGAGLAALVSLFAFTRAERRSPSPMLPLTLFDNPRFSATSFTGLLVNVAFYGLIFVLSLYFQRVGRHTALWTGLAFVPMTGVVLFMNLAAPSVTDRIGARRTIAIGAILAAVGCVGLFSVADDSSYPTMCLQLIAMGAGLGLLVPPLTSTLLGSVDKAQSGIASGVLNAMRQTGSVIGVALLGSFVARTDAFVAGLRLALVTATAALVAACAVVLIGLGAPARDRRPISPSNH